MYKVEILNLEIYAFVGFYPEEQIIGNYFYVDVSLEMPSPPFLSDSLDHFINYESLAKITKEEFHIKHKLIETTAFAILGRLDKLATENSVKAKINVCIRKKNPALGVKVDYSCITVSN